MMLSVVSDFFVSEKSSYCDAWISNSVPIRLPYKIRSPRSRLHVPKPCIFDINQFGFCNYEVMKE